MDEEEGASGKERGEEEMEGNGDGDGMPGGWEAPLCACCCILISRCRLSFIMCPGDVSCAWSDAGVLGTMTRQSEH